jgi:hypothetical protein
MKNFKLKLKKFIIVKEIPTRKDGKPDMRRKENRIHLVDENGVRINNDGTPDMRLKDNRKNLVTEYGTPANKNGKPDMRSKVNKQLYFEK